MILVEIIRYLLCLLLVFIGVMIGREWERQAPKKPHPPRRQGEKA